MGGRGGEGGSRAKPGNQLVYIYIYIYIYIEEECSSFDPKYKHINTINNHVLLN